MIKDLNAFNSELAAKRDLPRLYDIKSNTLIQSNLTRVNWRAFWIADAGGALKGGRWGARFGSAFSPSGTIAGAVVGGLLCGAISSALEEWVENGVAMAEIIQDFDVCDAEVVYDEFCQISPVELTTAKNEIEIASLAIDSVFQTVGIAHNVFLGRILETTTTEGDAEISLASLDNPTEEREEESKIDIAIASFDIFYSQECAGVVASEEYKEDYSEYMNKRLNSVIGADDDSSMADYIMNLFFEAAILNGGTSNDIVSIANYYYSLVEDSPELSDEDRYAICIGMAVASYSAKYWEAR